MTLYRATAEGNVPMTAEEEATFLAEQAQAKEEATRKSASIDDQLAAIRKAVISGDKSDLEALNAQIAATEGDKG